MASYRCLDCQKIFDRGDGPGAGDCPFCGYEYMKRLKPFLVVDSSGTIHDNSGPESDTKRRKGVSRD